MAEKRIRNDKNHHYYAIRQYNTKNGNKGQIKGKWHNKHGK